MSVVNKREKKYIIWNNKKSEESKEKNKNKRFKSVI